MRRVITLCAVLLVANFASAQVRIIEEPTAPPPGQALSHGGFAELMLIVVATEPGPDLEPEEALLEAKRLELVPQTWRAEDLLTHGELADVLESLGAYYQPADPDAYASLAFTEALLRRNLIKLRMYVADRLGHGTSMMHMLDEGADRAPIASPSEF